MNLLRRWLANASPPTGPRGVVLTCDHNSVTYSSRQYTRWHETWPVITEVFSELATILHHFSEAYRRPCLPHPSVVRSTLIFTSYGIGLDSVTVHSIAVAPHNQCTQPIRP